MLSVAIGRARITAGDAGDFPGTGYTYRGSAVGKAVPAGDAVYPWLCH